MKLKAKEVYDMYDAINALSQEKTTMPTAYYIAKNTKIIKEEAASIDEARQKLIMEFGEKKDDGSLNTQENGMVKIEDSKLTAFTEQLNSLLNAEIDIDIKKIPLSSLQQINIPINSVEVLLPIIIDDMEEYKESCCECDCASEPDPAQITVDNNGQILEMN